MSAVLGFSDSNNIVMINGVPHFKYDGTKFIDKLKNGLSLDYVFQMEDTGIVEEDTYRTSDEEEYKQPQVMCHELYEEQYDICDKKLRKGKNRVEIIKPQKKYNAKKCSSRKNGYSDKLFNIEQNTDASLKRREDLTDYEYDLYYNEAYNYSTNYDYDYDDDWYDWF